LGRCTVYGAQPRLLSSGEGGRPHNLRPAGRPGPGRAGCCHQGCACCRWLRPVPEARPLIVCSPPPRIMKPRAAARPPNAMHGSSATATPAATGSASSSMLACGGGRAGVSCGASTAAERAEKGRWSGRRGCTRCCCPSASAAVAPVRAAPLQAPCRTPRVLEDTPKGLGARQGEGTPARALPRAAEQLPGHPRPGSPSICGIGFKHASSGHHSPEGLLAGKTQINSSPVRVL
jgi:hypothetical protein